jgi:hypothetical protein
MARRVGFGNERPTDWVPYLDADEEIIWTGESARNGGATWGSIARFAACGGIVALCGFIMSFIWAPGAEISLLGYLMLLLIGITGLPFLAMLFSHLRKILFPAPDMRYALTNRRGFIGQPQTGAVKSYPTQSSGQLRLQRGPPDTVFFASSTIRGRESKGPYRKRVDIKIPIGFEQLDDAADAYQMLWRIRYGEDA